MTHEKFVERIAESYISLGEKLILFGALIGLLYLRMESPRDWNNDLAGFIFGTSLIAIGFYLDKKGFVLLKTLVDSNQ